MKKKLFLLIIILLCLNETRADRIYVMYAGIWSWSYQSIVSELKANGHTVIDSTSFIMPTNFTSRCVDTLNGFDWLCIMGDKNFIFLTQQIRDYINVGGKVFFLYDHSLLKGQYSATYIANQMTNQNLFLDTNESIASSPNIGWISRNLFCCINITGAAYKGIHGVPIQNQLCATETLPTGSPSIELCRTFGYVFATTDFPSSTNKGGIICISDINVFMDSTSTIIKNDALNFFFPTALSSCYIFPPGCLTHWDNNILNVSLGKDSIILCEGQNHLLKVDDSRATFIWQDGSKADHFLVTKAGKYWVSGTLNGCTQSDTITVLYKPGPVANLGSDRTICKGESFTLDVSYPNANYVWQDSSVNPYFTVSDTGTYWVKVSTSDCASSDTIIITKCTMPLIIPNVFTPNDDGVNDEFRYQHAEDWDFTTQIFNRWGALIYNNSDSKFWDGTYQGKEVPSGVYFYMVQAKAIKTGEIKSYKGSVTVVRE